MRQRHFHWLFIVFMVFSGVAFGQEGDPKALFAKGETYYNVGEWEQALANYKEAYILSNEPALLFNMAQCYRQLNRYDDSIRTYKNFLKEVPDTEIRSLIEGFITDMEARRSASSAPATLAVAQPVSSPTSAALTSAPPTQEPGLSSKRLLFAGFGGGAIVAGVLAGISLWRYQEVRDTTLGTFTPFPL